MSRTVHNTTDYWNRPCDWSACGWHSNGETWCEVARLTAGARALYLEWLERPDVLERLVDQGVDLAWARSL